MTHNRKIKTTLVSLAFCMVPLALMHCGSNEAEKVEQIRPVKTAIVSSGDRFDNPEFSGITVAGSEVKLSFRVGGTLLAVPISIGDRVKKGDLIARIDDKDAQTSLQKAILSLEKSKIQKETSQSNFNRVRELYENNSVSLNEYDAAKEKLAVSKAQLDADLNALKQVKREVGYYELHAPMNGIITTIEYSKNENIQAGAVIAVLQTGKEMKVNVGVPDHIINRIKHGLKADLRFSAMAEKTFQGEVIEIAYSADAQTSTYLVTIQILNPTKNLRPGMAVDALFNLPASAESDSILIPPHSVGQDPEGNFVFVLTPQTDGYGTVSRRKVETGGLVNDGILILSGLKHGEEIVTAGLASLHDGKKVRILK